MNKRLHRSAYIPALIFLSIVFNNCLTGIYLSEQLFGRNDVGMDQMLLLGILSQSSSNGSNTSPTTGNSGSDDYSGLNNENGSPETEPDEPLPAPRVATPTFNLSPGVFLSPVSISLNSETDNSEIYYTLDGEEPQPGASNTTLFEEPLPISSIAGLTIRAKAIKENYEASEETTGLYSLRTLRTGQVNSFQPNDDGDLQPGGEFNYTGPTQHPIYTNDYTTTDNHTGLVWKTCRDGRSGADCESGETNFRLNWHNAIDSCNALNNQNGGDGYAGRTDWRLPQFRELESLFMYNLTGISSLSSVGFPNANLAESFVYRYWTSTLSNRFGDDFAMDILMRGNLAAGSTIMFTSSQFTTSQLVRCVAGNSRTLETPIFVDNGDSTILDRVTGLTWTKCAGSQDINNNCSGGSGGFDWLGAFEHCNQLTLTNFARRSWRLPTIRELITLFRPESLTQPRTYTEFFPNTLQMYWSSTTRANNNAQAWIVQFNDGRVNVLDKTSTGLARTRCVAVD